MAKRNNSLTAQGKVRLIRWLMINEEKCKNMTGVKLAEIISEELGFGIAADSVCIYRNEIYPDLKRIGNYYSKKDFFERMDEIETRLSKIEKEFGIK